MWIEVTEEDAAESFLRAEELAGKLRRLDAAAEIPVKAVMYTEVDCGFPLQKGWVTGCGLEPPEDLLPDGIWLQADLFWRLPPRKAIKPQVPFNAAELAAKLESMARVKPHAVVYMYAMVDAEFAGFRVPEVGEIEDICIDRLLRPNGRRNRPEQYNRHADHRICKRVLRQEGIEYSGLSKKTMRKLYDGLPWETEVCLKGSLEY